MGRWTFGLGHGLVVEQQVAVGAHSSRLAAGEVRPDAGVRVQAEREVVLNQVLPAHPKVHRVPVAIKIYHRGHLTMKYYTWCNIDLFFVSI